MAISFKNDEDFDRFILANLPSCTDAIMEGISNALASEVAGPSLWLRKETDATEEQMKKFRFAVIMNALSKSLANAIFNTSDMKTLDAYVSVLQEINTIVSRFVPGLERCEVIERSNSND